MAACSASAASLPSCAARATADSIKATTVLLSTLGASSIGSRADCGEWRMSVQLESIVQL